MDVPTCEQLTSLDPERAAAALRHEAARLTAEAARLRAAADLLLQIDEVAATLAPMGPAHLRRLARDAEESLEAEFARPEMTDWDHEFWRS